MANEGRSQASCRRNPRLQYTADGLGVYVPPKQGKGKRKSRPMYAKVKGNCRFEILTTAKVCQLFGGQDNRATFYRGGSKKPSHTLNCS